MAVGASKLAAFRGARAVQTGAKGGRFVTLSSGKRWYVPDNYGVRAAASGAIPRAPVAKPAAPPAAVSRPRVGHEGPIPDPKPGPWIDHVAHLPALLQNPPLIQNQHRLIQNPSQGGRRE